MGGKLNGDVCLNSRSDFRNGWACGRNKTASHTIEVFTIKILGVMFQSTCNPYYKNKSLTISCINLILVTTDTLLWPARAVLVLHVFGSRRMHDLQGRTAARESGRLPELRSWGSHQRMQALKRVTRCFKCFSGGVTWRRAVACRPGPRVSSALPRLRP